MNYISIINLIFDCIILIMVLCVCFMYIISALYSRIMKKRQNKYKVNQTGNPEIAANAKQGGVTVTIKEYMSGLCRYATIFTGKIPSHTVRKFLYRNVFCMEIHKKAVIYGGCEFRAPWNISIGKSIIGLGSILDGRNGIEIKNNVCTATECYIWTEQHDINDPMFGTSKKENKKVIIDDHAWITSRTTILPGVHVGEGAVVAAGAVVTKDCEPFSVYVGIPAKKIAERNNNLKYELCENNSFYHFY